jgi:hypothetical protein
MGKTLEVIVDRANRPDDIVAAREVLDVRYSSPVSLRAAKLLHLLVDAAGVDVCKDMIHTVPIQSLNVGKESKAEFLETVHELFNTTMTLSILNSLGGRATKLGTFLADAEIDDDNLGDLRFTFSSLMRKVIEKSDTWGVLSAKAVIAFRSRYSLKLYEFVSARINLKHTNTEKLAVHQIREMLNVPIAKLLLWKDLRVRALDPAVAEVNQLAGFFVHYEPIMKGRIVWGVNLYWSKKKPEHLAETALEQERASPGRKARREGTTEVLTAPAPALAKPETDETLEFPSSGSLHFTVWRIIALRHLPEPARDVDWVADQFRAWAHREGKPLKGKHIRQMFEGFCRKQKPA